MPPTPAQPPAPPRRTTRIHVPNPRYANSATAKAIRLTETTVDDTEIDDAVLAIAAEERAGRLTRVTRAVSDHRFVQSVLAGERELGRKEWKRFWTASCTLYANTAMLLDNSGNELKFNAAMRGPDREHWERANHEEWIRLLYTTCTLRFISKADLPTGAKPTYFNPKVKVKTKPDGSLKYRVRGCVGGDHVLYNGNKAALTAASDTLKLFLNAKVSEGKEFGTADIVDFYLGTPLLTPEYMRVYLRQIPIAIQHEFGIFNPQADQLRDSVLVQINKTMYGLPQAGILSQERLFKHLAKHGYHPCPHTPCLFAHETRDFQCTLVVDDFAMKYGDQTDRDHFLSSLREQYDVTTDSGGDTFKYIGYTIAFDRNARTCSLTMPDYIPRALQRFHVSPSAKPVDTPIAYVAPDYGQRSQLATHDVTAPLDAKQTKFIQEVVGVLLFYARAVDPTMLCAISKISSAQAKRTTAVLRATENLLLYAASHPTATVTYHASDMRLISHSDASYLSESGARSRAGGIHFLGNHGPAHEQLINGAVSCLSSIIPAVTSSAAESEYAALFLNATDATGLRTQLADMGYPQDASPIIVDNKCAVGIANTTVKIKRTKAIDMRWHWVRDRVRQGHFTVEWHPGRDNLADFFTKAHPATHHRAMRHYYVQ
jgi:hypothetical protein